MREPRVYLLLHDASEGGVGGGALVGVHGEAHPPARAAPRAPGTR